MKKRYLLTLIITSFGLVGIIWWLFDHQGQKNISKPSMENSSSFQQPPKSGQVNPLPLQKLQSQSNPVESQAISSDLKEYLQKLRQDHSYEWKLPINFYGRVVNESNEPIANADVHFGWNVVDEKGIIYDATADTKSDALGFFSLRDKKGDPLEVTVTKQGYYPRNSIFWYRPDRGPFKPDQNNPVVFYLRKKGIGADLIHGLKAFGSRIDGTLSYVDLTESKNSFTPPGDLTVQFTRSEKNADRKFDWTFSLGVLGGGLIESTDEFMFLAPEEGYQPTFEISYKAGDPDWVSQEKHKFYVKSQDGRHYARIEITIIPDYGNVAAYDLNWDLNPNSSRNLEPK